MVGESRFPAGRNGGGLGVLPEVVTEEFLDGVELDRLDWEEGDLVEVVKEELEALELALKRPRVICCVNCMLSAAFNAYGAILSLSKFRIFKYERSKKSEFCQLVYFTSKIRGKIQCYSKDSFAEK